MSATENSSNGLSVSDADHVLKVVHIGESGVGKTAILLRFCEDEFAGKHIATIGVDFKIKTVLVDGETVKMQLWDTAGQERFKALTATYYRLADGFIVCYDITNRRTFDRVRTWLSDIASHSSGPGYAVMLVGNKVDVANGEREGQVTYVEGQKLAQMIGADFCEVSAKRGEHVTTMYDTLIKSIVQRRKKAGRLHSSGNPGAMAHSKSYSTSFRLPANDRDRKEKDSGHCCF